MSMKLYELKGKKLSHIRSTPFKLERDIQNVVEGNVEELFGLELVKSEMSVGGFRFDTLCYDRENNSFVIIEYKKGSSYSVIDQGYTYLSILLNNKSDFILEYNETMDKNLKRDELDWSQSRIIFVSPKFSEYQKNSINFKNVPFELWEVKQYEGGLVSLNKHSTTSTESIDTISSPSSENIVESVSREVKVYTEQYHYERKKTGDKEVIELYEELRERITNLGDVDIVPRKFYIGFKRKTNFVDVIFMKDHLILTLNLKKGEIEDSKGISGKGRWGNGDYEVRVYPNDDLDYLMFLIKQSYNKQGE